MNDTVTLGIPKAYREIEDKTQSLGFTMASDLHIGALLRTLTASKPNGSFLELGTGTGLSLSWIIDGMDDASTVISIDNDPELIKVATEAFSDDKRVKLICQDGALWLEKYQGNGFDLIFADAWPGKYNTIEKTLDMLKQGGLYVIDDMKHQANWPAGHQDKVDRLIAYLENREDLYLTKLNWSTGIILATKI